MEDLGLENMVVVDANVVIHSRAQFPFDKALIPPSVMDEVKSDVAGFKLEKLDIEVFQPSEEYIDKVADESSRINSPTSDQDEEALALALEKNLTLVTDDKALQNLALHLEHSFEGFNTEGVEEKVEWSQVCENCGREVSSFPCPRCGEDSGLRKRD
jgi:UPF0271 protein